MTDARACSRSTSTFVKTLLLSKTLNMSQRDIHGHKLNSQQRECNERDQITRVCDNVPNISEKAHRYRRSMCSQRQRLHASTEAANQCEAVSEDCEKTALTAGLLAVDGEATVGTLALESSVCRQVCKGGHHAARGAGDLPRAGLDEGIREVLQAALRHGISRGGVSSICATQRTKTPPRGAGSVGFRSRLAFFLLSSC